MIHLLQTPPVIKYMNDSIIVWVQETIWSKLYYLSRANLFDHSCPFCKAQLGSPLAIFWFNKIAPAEENECSFLFLRK